MIGWDIEDQVDHKFRVLFAAFSDGMEAGLYGRYTADDNGNSPLYLRIWKHGWEQGARIRLMTFPPEES